MHYLVLFIVGVNLRSHIQLFLQVLSIAKECNISTIVIISLHPFYIAGWHRIAQSNMFY